MEKETIGGVSLKDVIAFQTRILFGNQYGRIMKEDSTQDDLLIACLRIGWNDAFRHVSVNKKDGNESVLEKKSKEWKKNHKGEWEDYISDIILKGKVLGFFQKYAETNSTDEKIQVIQDALDNDEFKNVFLSVKESVCFGHIQKLFNMAIKFYLCLYFCAEHLNISKKFDNKIVANLKYADCPIDSIILSSIAGKTAEKRFSNYKWSKFGADDSDNPTEAYKEIQETIRNLVDDTQSNLYFDFTAWNGQDAQ